MLKAGLSKSLEMSVSCIGLNFRLHAYYSLLQMGFTENSHPHLSEKITVLLPAGEAVSKDREDDIVTSLLEELIPLPPKSSQPASGRRNGAIPGGWH